MMNTSESLSNRRVRKMPPWPAYLIERSAQACPRRSNHLGRNDAIASKPTPWVCRGSNWTKRLP